MPRLTTEEDRAVNFAVGARVKLRRRVLRLTQEGLADLLGVSSQQLQKYESGIDNLILGRLFQIATVLRAPIEEFLVDLDERPATDAEADSPKAERPLMTRQGMRLLRSFARISDPKTRQYVAELVDGLASRDE